MPEMTGLTTELLAAIENDGPGALLRITLFIGLVGAPLLAWIVLRGYGNKD